MSIRGFLRRNNYLGWGLLTSWGLCGMASFPDGPNAASAIGPAANCLAFGLAAVALFVGSTGKRLEPLFQNKRLSFCCALVMAASTAAMYLVENPAFGYLGLAVASSCYAWLSLAWGQAYRSLDAQEIERFSILSTLTSAAIYLASLILPAVAGAILRHLLPIASAACLLLCGEKTADASETSQPASPSIKWTAAATTVYALVLASPGLAIARDAQAFTVHELAIAGVPGIVLAAILVVYCVLYSQRINLNSFFRIICPLTVGGYFLLSTTGNIGFQIVGFCLVLAAQWMLYLFVWIWSCESTSGQNTHGLARLAALRACFDLGFLASGVAANTMYASLLAVPVPRIAFGLCALLCATLLFPEERSSGKENDEAVAQSGNWQNTVEAIARHVDAFADIHGLSARERQILLGLVRGHTSAAIRNEIGLAKSTVDTYTHRIYEKCGVSGRQELLDLFESVEHTFD